MLSDLTKVRAALAGGTRAMRTPAGARRAFAQMPLTALKDRDERRKGRRSHKHGGPKWPNYR